MKIYKSSYGYMVHNSHKPFKQAHTHINNYDTAKYVAKMAFNKTVPKHLSEYLLVSLIRISEDSEYKTILYSMLDRMRVSKEKKEREESL